VHIHILCLSGLAGAALGLRLTFWPFALATPLVVAIVTGIESASGAPWRAIALSVVLAVTTWQIGYLLAVLRPHWLRSRALLVAAIAFASLLPLHAIAFSQMRTGKDGPEPMGFALFCMAKPQRCEKSEPQIVTITPQRWRELWNVQWSVNHDLVKWSGPTGLDEIWRDEGSEGSCVLYANTKRSMLLDLGWPPSTLLLTLVRVDGKSEDHLVLVVRTDRGDLVLESLGDGMDYNYIGPYEVYRDHRWIKQMSPENPHFWRRIISWLRVHPGAIFIIFKQPSCLKPPPHPQSSQPPPPSQVSGAFQIRSRCPQGLINHSSIVYRQSLGPKNFEGPRRPADLDSEVATKGACMRVLLIEDESATAQSIELMLKSESFNVCTTDLGEEGIDLGKLYDYDIILLDLNLPDMSGFEVLRKLRVSKVKTSILVLSGLADIENKIQGLGLGADDYMTKPFHKDELVARIRAIVRRSKGHAQSVIQTDDLIVNLNTRTIEIDGARVHLTAKEYQMLELLSLRKGKTLTKEMFLNHLYGGLDEPQLKIIDVFICKLRKKLATASGGKDYIETVWGRGYVLRPAVEEAVQHTA